MKNTAKCKLLERILVRSFVLFILFFAQTLFIRANAQEVKLTIQLRNVSVKEVLSFIEKESKIVFFYSDKDVDLKRKLNINVVNQSVSKVLAEVFKNSSNDFKIDGNQVYIVKKPKQVENVKPATKLIRVNGIVTDENNQTVIGATVMINGTTKGTITDVDGKFSIEAPEESQLKISYVGYENKLVDIAGKQTFQITLAPASKALSEVVVIGFGRQKKENLTGSISSVSVKGMIENPAANVSNMLVGNATGVSGLQTSGEPGRNTTQIYIRGTGTYGNSSPLVIIDGIEQPAEQSFTELNAMDPNDIASISVLKDAASTAVYGIRGANGIIIVTTKRGNLGKPVFDLTLNYGSTSPVNYPQSTNAYEWASFRNTAVDNDAMRGNPTLSYLKFSQTDLWKFRNDRDYTPDEVAAMTNLSDAQKAQLNNSPAVYYGSGDIMKLLFGYPSPQRQINLNMSGGNNKIKYYVTLGNFQQTGNETPVHYYGATTQSSYNRYNFRSNFDFQATQNTKISINLSGQYGVNQLPGQTSSNPLTLSRYYLNFQWIVEANPVEGSLDQLIDGKLVQKWAGIPGSAQNPLGIKQAPAGNQLVINLNGGYYTVLSSLLSNSIVVDHKMDYLTKGLSFRATANYQNNYTNVAHQTFSVPVYLIQRNSLDPNKIDFINGQYGANSFDNTSYNSTWEKIYFDAGFDYNRSFGNHKLTALLLGKASQYNMPNDRFNTPSGLMGLVSRVTYNFNDRYLLEYDLGLNGTEQFAPGNRFGFFPAYSVGWVPTNEPFFKENDWITFLKVRASYGEVGNDLTNTGQRYLYLPNSYIDLGSASSQQGYNFGNSNGSTINPYYVGTSENSMGNPLVTWERAEKLDIGLDLHLLKERLSLTADYYNENRNNILTYSGIIPLTFGVQASNTPPVNIGKTYNEGYEFELSWKDKIGEVGYSINLGLSYAKNKIIYQAEAPNPYPWMNKTGQAIGQYYGLVSDGFFNNAQQLANRPFNTFTNNIAILGDLRYKDINGDGKIDNKDIVPIGYSNLPQYHFNSKLSVNYKGFDLSILLVGSANGDYYLNQAYVTPFKNNYGNAWEWMYQGQWTPEKAASGATITYPSPTINGSNNGKTSSNNLLASDFWLKSTNYFRIKSIEVSYSFSPKLSVIRMLNINRFRVYCNANNIYTFKNQLSTYGIDPEQLDTGIPFFYPLTQTINFGLNIQF